ncbi:sugar transferase [Sphingomonas mucosissima]|uniref:UDP-glucose:undecaprenyl-phosphate glucose-1-phosphate transferase n=1 Tax=Sphingomonas mucosissima TaxID=370959 RepID=A0A245ZQC5_9SPHN|nr:sugar transferase [Sphingomonas mucosissima]OWK31931.1 UDP-glucose:undecaprenyl-phosphate glucose-1-phosphate transferase [Sphingomonas mucosissima]
MSEMFSSQNWLTPVENDTSPSEDKRAMRLRFYAALVAGDMFSLGTGFTIGRWIADLRELPSESFALLAAVLPIYLLLGSRAYSATTLERWRSSAWIACAKLLTAFLTTIFVAFLLKEVSPISRLSTIFSFVGSATLLLLVRSIIGVWSERVFRGAALSRMLIIDGVNIPLPPGLKIVSSEPVESTETTIHPLALDRLARQLKGVDEVYVACPPARRANWATVLKGTSVQAQLLIPELDTIGVIGNKHFAGIASVLVSAGGLKLRERILKRMLDLLIAVPALIFLAPLLLVVAFAVKLDSRGPILFVQTRVGKGNHLFAMYKFRSMRQSDCDSDGNVSTLRDDARITRVGKFIRATSIDELPQLLNILKGDMSFVGPRPHAIGSLAGDKLFWEVDQRYHHRHVCKPGLTGLAQVRGFRGATHRREDLVNRLDADLEYVNGWSLMRDVMILVATLKVVVHRNAF